MSLRTKLLLITFVFMVIVVGLLTLNLAIDAAASRAREQDLQARFLERLVADWVREAGGDQGFSDWSGVAQRLSRSALLDNWAIVASEGDGLRVLSYGDVGPAPVLDDRDRVRLLEALHDRKTASHGARVYLPIEMKSREIYALRIDLKPNLRPGSEFGETLRGIVTIMSLGTVLLLLSSYVFLNRLVLRPLEELVRLSERVAAGDFSQKVSERPTFDEMGRLERAFNLMIDKVGQHQENLREKITKTERRLFQAQRLSATGTLAAGIAHEINNPLGGMLNAARAMQAGRLDDAKRAEYVELIIEGMERMRSIVQRILQFRPKEIDRGAVRMREVVDRAVAFCEHRFRHRGVEVRNEIPADLSPAHGDTLELQQAILNVLMNAVDACEKGKGLVRVMGRREADAVRIAVEDNGSGMDREALARCTDPFFTTKDPGEGTGLGLAVVQSILEHHGGRLEIESKKGEGTTVHLVLKCYES